MRWKPTSVTALSIALPLCVLSIVAPLLWQRWVPNWSAKTPAPAIGLSVESPPPLTTAWEDSPRVELFPAKELARLIPRDLVGPQDHLEAAPAADAPWREFGPETHDMPVQIQPDRLPPEVIADERPDDMPTVTGPVLETAEPMDVPSRDIARVEPEPIPDDAALPPPVWPEAESLVAQIDRLAELEPDFVNWCAELKLVLGELRQQAELNSDASRELLHQLTSLRHLGEREAAARKNKPAAARATRVTLALARRLAMWQIAAKWKPQETPVALPLAFDLPSEWPTVLSAARRSLNNGQAGATWVEYLKLKELDQLSSPNLTEPERRELARDVLRRMSSSQLTDEQVELMSSPPFNLLQQQLALFASESLNMVGLLADLEKFETEPLSITARPIAYQYEVARWSTDPIEQELAEQMNAHYRNANVRVAFSAELLNRVLPQMNVRERVTDNIQGAAVHGESHTATKLRVVLFPDRWRWRMGLEARGEVASSTSSTKGPATFYQDGYSQFKARKMMTIDRRNISLFNAEAVAASNNTLTDYETEYDGIPIFNSIARSIARQQYDEQSGIAKHEVENKIAGRASRTLDQQVDARVNEASTQLKSQLLAPLQQLDLDPTAIDMETTETRLIARYRLAGHEQLGSSSPRPQAPGDCWLSCQVHQSAINNMLAHLNLEGEKKELRSLYTEIGSLFVQKKIQIPEDIPENVFVTFAEHDAVYIDCEKGRVRVTIRLKELAHEKSRWRNFTVRAYYVPDPDQKSANLVRDGVIELIGTNLRLGDQVALRGIFSRVLSRNRTINLINESLAKSKALKDLHVSQFAIQDGWVGISLTPGPQRPILYTRPPPAAEPKADDEPRVGHRPAAERSSVR